MKEFLRWVLFGIGLVWGLLWSLLLGLGYGLAYGLRTLWEIGSAMARYDAIPTSEGSEVILIIIGFIAAVGAVFGFLWGTFKGVTEGVAHCALDFYNNGFLSGLTSPFRFLRAVFNKEIFGNQERLQTYYRETHPKRVTAQDVLRERCQCLKNELGEITLPEGQVLHIPNGPASLIAQYALDPEEIPLASTAVDRWAEQAESKGLGQQRNGPLTVATYYTKKECPEFIRTCGIFADSARARPNAAAVRRPSQGAAA